MTNKTITKPDINATAKMQRELDQLRTYADALNARCVADAADAERYRLLRDATFDWEALGIHWGQPSYWPLEHLSGDQLDAAVDRALKK